MDVGCAMFQKLLQYQWRFDSELFSLLRGELLFIHNSLPMSPSQLSKCSPQTFDTACDAGKFLLMPNSYTVWLAKLCTMHKYFTDTSPTAPIILPFSLNHYVTPSLCLQSVIYLFARAFEEQFIFHWILLYTKYEKWRIPKFKKWSCDASHIIFLIHKHEDEIMNFCKKISDPFNIYGGVPNIKIGHLILPFLLRDNSSVRWISPALFHLSNKFEISSFINSKNKNRSQIKKWGLVHANSLLTLNTKICGFNLATNEV